jgi:hypothetical protein
MDRQTGGRNLRQDQTAFGRQRSNTNCKNGYYRGIWMALTVDMDLDKQQATEHLDWPSRTERFAAIFATPAAATVGAQIKFSIPI